MNQHLNERRSTPWHLWVLGAVSLLWNGMGTFLWGGTTFSPDTFLADLPADHRAYVASLPFWSTITWGAGVLGGTAGAILLLLRQRLSLQAFGLSLAGAITNQLVYLTNPPPPGFLNIPLTAFIIGFAALQVWYANREKRHGVL